MTLHLDTPDANDTHPLAPADVVGVTIAIPAYKPHYLEAALRSAVEQDFEDFEVVVCDDSAGNAIADIVARYAARQEGPRVRYFRNLVPLGEEGNVGECIRRARGRYIKFLYDDDLLLPGCLRRLADVLDRHPDVALVTSRRHRIDEQGNRLPDIGATRSPFATDVRVDGTQLVSLLADWTLNFIGEPSSVMVRREQVLPLAGKQFSLGGRKVSWLGDLTMHVNLMRLGDLVYLVEPLSSFRVSREQTSHASLLDPNIGNEWYAYFKRTIRESGWHRDVDNHLVRVAPLETPDAVETLDLGRRIKRMARGLEPIDPLRHWLAPRTPTPVQASLMAARPGMGEAPRIAVLIRAGHDTAALGATLDSLKAQPGHAPADLFVIGGPVPPPDAALPQMQHVPLAPDEDVLSAINRTCATYPFDWMLMVDAGETFTPAGLLVLAHALLGTDGLRAVYADEMMRGADGELSALLRPDFNLDLLLSMPSGLARHWLVRRDVFLEAGGFDPAFADAPEFDLLLRLIDAGGIDGLGHVHEPLLILPQQEIRTRQSETEALLRHLRNRGYDQAAVDAHHPGCYRIRYGHAATPGVSIIIPTKNQLGMLRRCVESLLEKTAYQNYEVLIVDNGSTDADACTWLDGIEAMGSQQLQVIRYPQPFNYSAMNNLAARHARGEYLVLLNNDTAVLREDWLDAMLNHAQRPEVGVVGAKLLYPDGRIQHAGVVLGLRGPAEHPFIGDPHDAPGYMHRLRVDQNYSAVTGACLMIRKSLYEAVGGLDEEAFKVSYNDVDLCLKARAAGHLVLWTPHAVLLHEGSVSQARVDTSALEAKAKRFVGEQDAFYDRWLPAVANDPAYNRNLTLNGPAFQVETDPTFTWNPLSWRPLPVALALPADRFGCGHYRVIQPAAAMNGFGVADVRVGARYSSPVEIERLSPDVVVLQRQMLKGQLEPQKRMLRWSRAFKVAELDDYLPNMPMKSAHRGQLPNDVLKTMRDALKLVDRFVVSTAPLAEALAGLHPDIRVVENRLPLPWWGAVTAQRRRGQRPRVGWGGGAGHRGDLELIADVVRELADEVEWVFLGMCPDKLRPYVHEFHPGVAIEDYPARLAGLDLDLALAPLEDNLFNRCKSNLRLLEYGACGFPVVCSDVAPYRGALPVTRVKPRFRDWVEAIRMHTHDLDAAARAGDALRDAVHRDWMLDEASAAHWLSQWLPE